MYPSIFSDKTGVSTASRAISKLLEPPGLVTVDASDTMGIGKSTSGPPVLQELSLSSLKLPYHSQIITSTLQALGRNDSLQVLDISGNIGGDEIAEALSQALRTNTSLKALFWDNNRTTLKGFRKFSEGLQVNGSVILVPVPIQDTRRILERRDAPREELFSVFGNICKCRVLRYLCLLTFSFDRQGD